MAPKQRARTRRRSNRNAINHKDVQPPNQPVEKEQLLDANADPRPPRVEATSQHRVSEIRLAGVAGFLMIMGTLGFYYLPGMLHERAEGSRLVNAFYCTIITLTTVGYGDICPGDLTWSSRLFLLGYIWFGMGFFCGPVLSMSSSWKERTPGGILVASLLVLAFGTWVFVTGEAPGVSLPEALYASIITGVTLGYGDITPSSDSGKLFVACYCIIAIPIASICLSSGSDFLLGYWKTTKVKVK